MKSVIFNQPSKVDQRSYRKGEYATFPDELAAAMTNSGSARYADGTPAAHPMVDGEGRTIRAFSTGPSNKAVMPKR
jgi:hypothetical protein